jgi:hypothetical protein
MVLHRPIETTRLTVQVEFVEENADFPQEEILRPLGSEWSRTMQPTP